MDTYWIELAIRTVIAFIAIWAVVGVCGVIHLIAKKIVKARNSDLEQYYEYSKNEVLNDELTWPLTKGKTGNRQAAFSIAPENVFSLRSEKDEALDSYRLSK